LKYRTRKSCKILSLLSEGISNKTLTSFAFQYTFDLSEKEALDNEIFAISQIGRIDIQTGILCNHTDGGDKGGGLSLEIKQKISEKTKGHIVTEETRSKLREHRKNQILPPLSIEARKSISEKATIRHAETTKNKSYEEIYGEEKTIIIKQKLVGRTPPNKGKEYPPEIKEKMRIGKIGKIKNGEEHYRTYPILVTTPLDKTFTYKKGVSNFYKEYNISKKQTYKMLKDINYSYNGWKIQKVEHGN
jgi:hypothetical protein